MAEQNHFLIRKVHSLLGIIPIGLFFVEHTITASTALVGPALWEKMTYALHTMPFKLPIELLLIFIPIAFHALYGLWIVYVAKNNALRYTYFRNWMFYLQRITALITLAFVIWHVWALRMADIYSKPGGHFKALGAILHDPIVFVVYLIGFISAAFHFANGLWSFLVSWGITIGPKAQSNAFVVCMVIFFLLSAAGIGALYSFL